MRGTLAKRIRMMCKEIGPTISKKAAKKLWRSIVRGNSASEPKSLPTRGVRKTLHAFLGFRGFPDHNDPSCTFEERRQWEPGPVITVRSIYGGMVPAGRRLPPKPDETSEKKRDGFTDASTRKGLLERLDDRQKQLSSFFERFVAVFAAKASTPGKAHVKKAPRVYPHSSTRQHTRLARRIARAYPEHFTVH